VAVAGVTSRLVTVPPSRRSVQSRTRSRAPSYGAPRQSPAAVERSHWFVDRTTDRRYEVLDRQFFDGGFVQQHILHADGRNGGSISMRVGIVIKVGANGLISRIDEYFDPAEIAPLLGS